MHSTSSSKRAVTRVAAEMKRLFASVPARSLSTRSFVAANVTNADCVTGVIHQKYNIPTHFNPLKTASEQDKLLFTPGPLTTSFPVKYAMTTDLGSRDVAFIQVIKDVRSGLLQIAGVSESEYTTVPIQGSGTFGVESVLSSAVDKHAGVLIIANGAYGMRMTSICKAHKIPFTVYECPDNMAPSLEKIEMLLKNEAAKHKHVAVVHSETTSGIVNDVETIGALVHKYGKTFIVDAMSSFGAVPVNFQAGHIDFLVSSSNKCIEGTPGFSFAICRKTALEACKGNASSLALDLYAQNHGLDTTGQFRFTPPTHPLIAFRQALRELVSEGGVTARALRYQTNQKVLGAGLKELGFELYLKPEHQGYIISSYHYPSDSNWDFPRFYRELNDRGFVIYPGKVSNADCFRIGHIGRLFPEDTQRLVDAIREVCQQMKTAKFYQP